MRIKVKDTFLWIEELFNIIKLNESEKPLLDIVIIVKIAFNLI